MKKNTGQNKKGHTEKEGLNQREPKEQKTENTQENYKRGLQKKKYSTKQPAFFIFQNFC